jgi:hypothetical protein
LKQFIGLRIDALQVAVRSEQMEQLRIE